jgi:signal transduction histidine kinase
MADVGRAEPRAMGRWPDVALVVAAVAIVTNLVMLVVAWPRGDEPWAIGQVLMLATAVVVRARRPGLAVSAWFAISVAPALVGELANTTLSALLERGDSATATAVTTAVVLISGGLGVAVTVQLLAVYPDQHADARWERWVLATAWMSVIVPVIVVLATPTVPVPYYIDAPQIANPLDILPVPVSTGAADLILGLANLLVLGGIAVVVAHYRRAERPVRRQMRWLLAPIPLVVFALLLNVLLAESGGVVTWVVLLLLQPAIPIAAAVGILQPRGWDADWVLRRGLVYGVLWLAIVGVLVTAAAVAGTAAGQFVPVGWAVTIALVVSLIFQPLRRRLETLADRRVFGERIDHSGVITRLGDTLAGTFELENLLPRMVDALEEGLQLTWARVSLRGVEHAKAPGDPDVVVPIESHGEQLGVVECGPKRDGQWTDDDRAVVATFARQAALAVRNVRLTEQTAHYAADLEVSRSRIARAAESERRRIERNIHDGIQQDLVVLIGMTGRMQTDRDPATVAAGMSDLRQRLEHILGDLRDLASGIYPSVLTDQGVLPALEALVASHPHPVRLRADSTLRELRLPEEIEGAAYFTVAEALTNSLKHADASRVDVTLSRINGSLLIEVEDDGTGFDASSTPSGRGLEGLADRLGALGGTLGVDTAVGRGTVVKATLSTTGKNGTSA